LAPTHIIVVPDHLAGRESSSHPIALGILWDDVDRVLDLLLEFRDHRCEEITDRDTAQRTAGSLVSGEVPGADHRLCIDVVEPFVQIGSRETQTLRELEYLTLVRETVLVLSELRVNIHQTPLLTRPPASALEVDPRLGRLDLASLLEPALAPILIVHVIVTRTLGLHHLETQLNRILLENVLLEEFQIVLLARVLSRALPQLLIRKRRIPHAR